METDELEQSQQIPEHRQCVCAYTREKDRTNQGNGKKMGKTGCQASLAFFNLLSNRLNTLTLAMPEGEYPQKSRVIPPCIRTRK